MTDEEWCAEWARCLGLQLSGKTLHDVDRDGEPIKDDTFLLCLNSHTDAVAFQLPDCPEGKCWELAVDTRYYETKSEKIDSGGVYEMMARSLTLFKHADSTK